MGNRRYEDSTEREALQLAVINALAELEPIHVEIIYFRHYCGYSLDQCAYLMGGVRRECARQLEARAMVSLRRATFKEDLG